MSFFKTPDASVTAAREAALAHVHAHAPSYAFVNPHGKCSLCGAQIIDRKNYGASK